VRLSAAVDLLKAFFRLILCVLALSSVLSACAENEAEDFHFDSAGARFGFSAESRSESFHQAEGFANWALPWGWDFGKDWHLQTRFDLAAGWLGGHEEDAFVCSAGPSLVLGYAQFPISLEGGCRPTFISRYEFGPTDLGSQIQFTSHAGLNWDIGWGLQIGYRFQHMSNAHISHHNPGLNLHMFAISYRF
jgi:hypothetical protein